MGSRPDFKEQCFIFKDNFAEATKKIGSSLSKRKTFVEWGKVNEALIAEHVDNK